MASQRGSRSDIPTAKVTPAPVVLCVACDAATVRKCRDSAIDGGATLVETDISNTATMCAQTRPLVLVVPEAVYEFDSASFDELAMDFQIRVVRLPPDELSQEKLDALILDAMVEAEQIRAAVDVV
jgi:hypothetical protein